MKHNSIIKKNIRLLVFTTVAITLTSLASAQEKKDLPVRIYILAGQSNMQGKGSVEGEKANTLRDMVKNDPGKEFQFLVNADGTWRERSDVWIHYDLYPFRELRHGLLKPGYGDTTGVIGPELGFGHTIGDAYDGQVLLIKAAWGGKSLGHDFLPPSTGKYPPPVKPEDPGYFFHRILELVREVTENIRTFFPDYKGQGIEFAGICWHQGWNDQYGGLDAKYEENMVAFINDIRSAEHGLGVPGLPVVIATSGMIRNESAIKMAQLAMGDTAKYPQFAGNVAVVDTDKPYGQKKLQFWFDTKDSPSSQGYHWNNNARSYMNVGMSMAEEMRKLVQPALPSRLTAFGTPEGVQLTWQLGTESPKSVKLLRNNKEMDAKLSATQTTSVDVTALPGKNTYELVFDMPTSPAQKLTAVSTTTIDSLTVARSAGGVTLTWNPKGKMEGYKISRENKVIEASLAAGATSYEDKGAPKQGLVTYSVQPSTGNAAPTIKTIHLGPIDPGDALVYEPFDYYPPDFKSPVSLLGMKGAVGTRGEYFTLDDKPKSTPMVVTGGLRFGELPVMGNCVQGQAVSKGCAIALDDSLEKAGLLKDGATMWMSYLFKMPRSGGGSGMVTLQSDDLKNGVGFCHGDRELQTVVVLDGKCVTRRIGPSKFEADTLIVGKFVWGKDGEKDQFFPMMPDENLKQPAEKVGEKYPYLRSAEPFNIDQSKLNRLVFQKGGNNTFDEIRVGPTYESVVGGGTK
jgi:hypothetical protein